MTHTDQDREIDWSSLTFAYYPTDYIVRCSYRDGSWSAPELSDDLTIPIHVAATALNYGQQAFEGLKAYRDPEGRVALFRPEANALRLQQSCRGIMMPEVPVETFLEAARMVVEANARFIPPYGTGAALYLRPLVLGVGPHVGVSESRDYLFCIYTSPVGPYFKEGMESVSVMIQRDHDRAAPKGTGRLKVGGNYAASFRSQRLAYSLGYDGGCLYLDPKEKTYIDECGSANFFGIKGNHYITPKSDSILPSVTNDSLMTLARDLGLTVEQRPMPVHELAELDEAAACGTAAVICPIGKIVDADSGTVYDFGKEPGPICRKLYNRLTGIQFGLLPDTHSWLFPIRSEVLR